MKKVIGMLVVLLMVASLLGLGLLGCGGNGEEVVEEEEVDTGTYSSGPIMITSDDQFTRANGVVSGSGTEADPYIIEGWTIDSGNSAITISSTSKYFVIRNCQIESGGNGISLSCLSLGLGAY